MTYDETLTIIHNAANEINPISLDGTGIPPAIPEGAVAYYNWDTGNGNTLYDNWGTNHGTIEDDDTHWSNEYPTFGTDGDGSPHSGDFDGVDDYVDVSSLVDILSSITSSTLSFWFNPEDITNQRALTSFAQFGTNQRFRIEIHTNSKLRINNELWDENIESDNVLSVGSWYHVVAVNNGTTTILYLNNELQTSVGEGEWFDDISGFDTANIGIWAHDNAGIPFDGQIDEVKIFDRALSEQEIENLYNYGSVYGR
jgi:hypothetical protein